MNRTRLKFIGSIALVLSTLGVLLAVGGQLNFLGNARPDATLVKKPTVVEKGKGPKYSFYDELKKRKVEVDQQSIATIREDDSDKVAINADDNDTDRYIVQIGAFISESDAKRTQVKAENLGYPIRIIKRGRHYLVQIGPFNGKKLAYTTEKKLKKQKFPTLVKRLK